MKIRSLDECRKIEKAMREDPENFPKRPEFFRFICLSESLSIYTSAYLKEDYDRTSPAFKKALQKYQDLLSDHEILNEARNVYSGVIASSKIYFAERKLNRLERKEGIKRYSSLEINKIMRDYNNKVDAFSKLNEKELEQ